jgi:hypothetical protein
MGFFTLKIPTTIDGKWGISFGKGLRKRNSAGVVYYALERHLRGYAKEEKVAIVVKDMDGIANETIKSNDPKYLLYTAGCFLEDFLSEMTMKRIENGYATEK